MTKQTKTGDLGDSQIDVSRRRVMRLMAAVTVLGTGLGIRMNKVFAEEAQRLPPPDSSQSKSTPDMLKPSASQSKSSPDLMRPGAQQQKASPKLMTNCAGERKDGRNVKPSAPGAQQQKASPHMVQNCAEDGKKDGRK